MPSSGRHILGLSCFYHDSAAALFQNGVLTACAEEERFTRKKHDSGFPLQAIDFVLGQGGVEGRDLDAVVFYEKPFVKFERILSGALQTYPRSYRMFRESMVTWLLDKLWIKNYIREHLGVEDGKILFSSHHLSHAAASFFCSPFDDAAILTVDGAGEWATATFGVGRGPDITIMKEIRFPHSLGLLYSAFTAFLGFEVNEGEYKVMGMAPYGKPIYTDKVWKLITLHPDGSFELNMDYFSFHYSSRRTYSRKFEGLFGAPRDPRAPFSPETAHEGKSRYYADIAASVQRVLEDVLVSMAGCLHRETGLTRLCVSGGVALNSVANWRILQETPFTDIYIQPAAGDSGGAVGAALYAQHMLYGQPRSFSMEHASWGKEYGPGAVDAAIRNSAVTAEEIGDESVLVSRTVELLEAGRVVGWFQGRFEWGPRALGHRSILADPRRGDMKDIVNERIKFREPFRPFAPSVPEEAVNRYFALAEPRRHRPSRFMLYVVPVLEEQRGRIPAVTHVDGTARLQTVVQEHHPLYHRLITAFGQSTGVPVLLNTSFNLKGEPIANTPGDAISTFLRCDMDALVLGNRLITRKPSRIA